MLIGLRTFSSGNITITRPWNTGFKTFTSKQYQRNRLIEKQIIESERPRNRILEHHIYIAARNTLDNVCAVVYVCMYVSFAT